MLLLLTCNQRPSIKEQVEDSIKKYGPTPPADQYVHMRADANRAFEQALRARAVDPGKYKLVVHRDELVGPMIFVQRKSDGRAWTLLSAFEEDLKHE